ncbi:serine hydrolase domain-containing protein [Flavobacterium hungaricum]|uniref:Class A beta-lactamase-related serine hydrolase n=1 Tax=Flavobacterium hungaricum TaxID=2082725 RepID=A0ABR9TMZ0_9FLAO|nr:serine hydrolase domain-containing protein [Flavobacterium hungaricum]MBE8726721.1 class A beta-lactamase-related serine hydrolase [Flavobacterium hungaricum]
MNPIFRLFTILFLLTNCILSAQKNDKISAQTDSTLLVSSPKFNGTILISKNGKAVYSKAVGFADFDKKTPLKLDSQFEIMSNTRQFTAVLILQEVEKGKIDLQAPIKKYLHNLKQSWTDSITVHQLLNHTHGIVDPNKSLAFKPGTEFKYGNEGYPFLGMIIESVSKKPYAVMAEALFKKLKMNNTFCYSKDNTRNLVTGYMNDKDALEKAANSLITPEKVPSAGIISTANDLLIWNNNLHKGKILKPETYQLMLQYNILAQHNVFGTEKVGYGYGLRIVDKESPKYYGHTGLGNGFSSVNLYFPESDVSIIVLENEMNANSDLFYKTGITIKKLLLKSNLFNPKQ